MRNFLRQTAIAILNLVGTVDEAIPVKHRQSLHPSWCNLHARECLYRCKEICLDADLPLTSP